VNHLKVLLTKEQAEALESALAVDGGKREQVVEWHLQDLWSGKREALNGMPLDTIIRALYVGYELDKSPEEKLIAYIQELHEQAVKEEIVASAKILGVMKTLEILNIDLKGMNANGTSTNI
jgi:hypothetical protein